MNKVNLIQRSLLLCLMSIISVYAYSQAYKYSCEYNEKIQKWQCISRIEEKINEKNISFSISGHSQYVCNMNFIVFPLTMDNSDQGLFEIYLSNGETLSTYVNDAALMISFNMSKIKSKNNPSIDYTDNGNYAMYHLRHYDITKLKFAGRIFETPNFHSAATIDAMCKSLISKTGDRGQYGSSLNRATNSNHQGSYAPTNTNDMTFHQMMCCLFGVVPENMTNGNLTFSSLKSVMSKYPQWNIKYTDYFATVKSELGFDMAYRGCPIDEYNVFFLEKQNLYSYKISFSYKTGNYQADATKQFSSILNDLRQAGATRREIKPEGARRCIFGDYAGREYSIHLYDYKNYSTVSLEIKVPRYTSGSKNANNPSTTSNQEKSLFGNAIIEKYSQQLHMERSVSVSSADIVNKVLGIFNPMSKMWELKSSLFHKSLSKAGGWEVVFGWQESGGFLKPPYPILYLGRPISPIDLYFDHKRDYCLDSQCFTIFMEHKADMNTYVKEVIADMQRAGFPLRKLNTSMSNIKHGWGCVSGDKFILIWTNKSVSSYEVRIDIQPTGSDVHKSYKLVNNFL